MAQSFGPLSTEEQLAALNDALIWAYARHAFFECKHYCDDRKPADENLKDFLITLFVRFDRQRNQDVAELKNEVVRLRSLVTEPTRASFP